VLPPLRPPAGTQLQYTVWLTSSGNVAVRNLNVDVQAKPALPSGGVAGIACSTTSGAPMALPAALPLGSSAVCKVTYTLDQATLEAGGPKFMVSASAINFGSTLQAALPTVEVPNEPGLSAAIDTTTCSKPAMPCE
jgi:hypothetical protein